MSVHESVFYTGLGLGTRANPAARLAMNKTLRDDETGLTFVFINGGASVRLLADSGESQVYVDPLGGALHFLCFLRDGSGNERHGVVCWTKCETQGNASVHLRYLTIPHIASKSVPSVMLLAENRGELRNDAQTMHCLFSRDEDYATYDTADFISHIDNIVAVPENDKYILVTSGSLYLFSHFPWTKSGGANATITRLQITSAPDAFRGASPDEEKRIQRTLMRSSLVRLISRTEGLTSDLLAVFVLADDETGLMNFLLLECAFEPSLGVSRLVIAKYGWHLLSEEFDPADVNVEAGMTGKGPLLAVCNKSTLHVLAFMADASYGETPVREHKTQGDFLNATLFIATSADPHGMSDIGEHQACVCVYERADPGARSKRTVVTFDGQQADGQEFSSETAGPLT